MGERHEGTREGAHPHDADRASPPGPGDGCAPREPHTTDDLLGRARQGNPWAGDDLCRRLQPQVEQRVRQHALMPALRRYMSHDDVLQEVWVRFEAARGWQRFEARGPGSLQAYLLGFVDHVVQDLLRRATAQKNGGGKAPVFLGDGTGELPVELPDKGPTPSSDARFDEIRELAERVLAPDELRVYRLSVPPESRTSAEIGELLDMHDSTVRNARARAIRKLYELLDDGEDELRP